jgi:hypothetical protein
MGVYLYRIYDQTSQLGYLPVAGSFVIRAQAKDLTDTHLLAQTKMRNPARSLLRNRPERTKRRQMALPGRSKIFSKK